jgi:hypothetical protein
MFEAQKEFNARTSENLLSIIDGCAKTDERVEDLKTQVKILSQAVAMFTTAFTAISQKLDKALAAEEGEKNTK